QWGLGRVHIDRSAALLPGGEQEGDLLLVTGELDRDGHAGTDHTLGARRFADLRGAKELCELDDAVLHLALLFLGGVVAAVLLEVALLTGCLDLLRDLDAPITRQVVQLGLEPVMRLLGEPGDVVIAGLGHWNSLCTRSNGHQAARAELTRISPCALAHDFPRIHLRRRCRTGGRLVCDGSVLRTLFPARGDLYRGSLSNRLNARGRHSVPCFHRQPFLTDLHVLLVQRRDEALRAVLAVDLEGDARLFRGVGVVGDHLVVDASAQARVVHHRESPPDADHDREDGTEDEEEGPVAVALAQHTVGVGRGRGRGLGTVHGVFFRGRLHRESPNKGTVLSKISPTWHPPYAPRA